MIASLPLLWLAGPACAALLINEILPDPTGTDAGSEFVEFLNIGAEPFDLEGVEFQFANGAEGPVWRVRWTGRAGQRVAAGGRFLLVDRTWAGAAAGDDEATLGLQNGPDAVRLVRDGVVLDLLGYGALTDPELSEGRPVALVPGLALARRPDGVDSGDNAADFAAADPTPGGLNFRPWSLAVIATAAEPPSLRRPGDAVTLQAELRNDGLQDWPAATVVLGAGDAVAVLRLDGMPAGQARTVAAVLRPLQRGVCDLWAAALPEGAPDSVRVGLGTLQVGAGPLVFSEVLAAPAGGQGEWFELAALGDSGVDLAGWEVRDEDGAWLPLPAVTVAPGAPCVVAQDSVALLGWMLEVEARGGDGGCPAVAVAGRTRGLGGWPALNNTPPESRIFADRLQLRTPEGVVADHVTVGAPGGPGVAGRSLERTSGDPVSPSGEPWAVCTAGPGSTPGCANSTALLLPAAAGRLTIMPKVLEQERGSLHFILSLEDGLAAWRLRIYDLWGRTVRDFGGDGLGPGLRDLLWDGRDDGGEAVPPGGYVAVLEWWSAAGSAASERQLCAVR